MNSMNQAIGRQTGALCTSDITPRTPQVTLALEELNEQVCFLDKNLQELAQRLSSVMLPDVPQDVANSNAPMPVLVKLADNIKTECVHLIDCNRRLSFILKAIEL